MSKKLPTLQESLATVCYLPKYKEKTIHEIMRLDAPYVYFLVYRMEHATNSALGRACRALKKNAKVRAFLQEAKKKARRKLATNPAAIKHRNDQAFDNWSNG